MKIMEWNGFKDKEECILDTEDVKKRLDEHDSQFENIENEVKDLKENQGTGVTQEQIDSAVTSYLTENPVTGGLTSTAKNLLIAILRNGVYTSDQSSNITNLISALSTSGGDTPSITYYNITNNLTNCINGNINSTIAENTSYIATITANSGYKLDTVTVTMGGTDITSSVYSNGQINISSVTGNIIVTATATEKSDTAELITNGLIDEFDFRTCEYNNNYPGNATLIKATRGNGGLFNWHTNVVISQNAQYGLEMGSFSYSADGTTTGADANDSFTQVFMSYMETQINPMFNSSYGSLSNLKLVSYRPSYVNTSNSKVIASSEEILERKSGWHTIILTADATTKLCKLYIDGQLVSTRDGNDYEDFSKWNTSIQVGMLNGSKWCTYFSLYDRALSEVEVIDTFAYLKTLEVA